MPCVFLLDSWVESEAFRTTSDEHKFWQAWQSQKHILQHDSTRMAFRPWPEIMVISIIGPSIVVWILKGSHFFWKSRVFAHSDGTTNTFSVTRCMKFFYCRIMISIIEYWHILTVYITLYILCTSMCIIYTYVYIDAYVCNINVAWYTCYVQFFWLQMSFGFLSNLESIIFNAYVPAFGNPSSSDGLLAAKAFWQLHLCVGRWWLPHGTLH